MEKKSDNLPENEGFIDAGVIGFDPDADDGNDAVARQADGDPGVIGIEPDTDDKPDVPAQSDAAPLFFLGDDEDMPEKPERFFIPKKRRKTKNADPDGFLVLPDDEPDDGGPEKDASPESRREEADGDGEAEKTAPEESSAPAAEEKTEPAEETGVFEKPTSEITPAPEPREAEKANADEKQKDAQAPADGETALTEPERPLPELAENSGKNKNKPRRARETSSPGETKTPGSPAAETKAKKPARRTGAFDVVRYVLLFTCFTVFLYCSYTLISSVIERSKSRDLYDDMRRIFYDDAGFEDSYLTPDVQNVPSVDLLSAYVGVQPPQPEIRLPAGSKLVDKVNYLKSINSDTVGWMTVDGTNIDYPVVHSADNDFYLRRDFYGRSNLSGTLFTDSRNSMKLMENRNTVVYGHNMNDGSMFNNLHDFRNESVFQSGRIQFVTANGIFIYEVFSVHEALETSEYFQTEFENDAHFSSYLADMQAQSLYKKEGMTLSPADKVLTLSTCLDPIIQSEYRWAVHAKLVQVVNYTP